MQIEFSFHPYIMDRPWARGTPLFIHAGAYIPLLMSAPLFPVAALIILYCSFDIYSPTSPVHHKSVQFNKLVRVNGDI